MVRGRGSPWAPGVATEPASGQSQLSFPQAMVTHGDSLRDDRRPKSGRVLSVPWGCTGQRPEGWGRELSVDPRQRSAEPRDGEGANVGDMGPLDPAVPEAGLGLSTTYNSNSDWCLCDAAPAALCCSASAWGTARMRSTNFTCRSLSPSSSFRPPPDGPGQRHTLLGGFWEAKLCVNSLTEPLLS